MARKDPEFFSEVEEEFYINTPKRLLHEMLRSYAIFDPMVDSADHALDTGVWTTAAWAQNQKAKRRSNDEY